MAATFAINLAIYKMINPVGTLITRTATTPFWKSLSTQTKGFSVEPIIPGDTASVTDLELKSYIIFEANQHQIREIWYSPLKVSDITTLLNA